MSDRRGNQESLGDKAYDDTLDFRSPNFDARKALHLRNLKTPVVALPLDNIHMCRKILPKKDPNYVSVSKVLPKNDEPAKDDKQVKKRKAWINPLDLIMEKLNYGPTKTLYSCWKDKKRVLVRTRSYNGVHSTLEGNLVAFDKHVNLILDNIKEYVEGEADPRVIEQLFIKGDNVILISRLD